MLISGLCKQLNLRNGSHDIKCPCAAHVKRMDVFQFFIRGSSATPQCPEIAVIGAWGMGKPELP